VPGRHAADRTCARAPPYLGGAAGAFQVAQAVAHDGVIERSAAARRSGRPTRFSKASRVVRDKAGVVQDPSGLPGRWTCAPGTRRCRPWCCFPRRSRRARMVERGVVQVGFFGQDVPGLANSGRLGLSTVRQTQGSKSVASAGRHPGRTPGVGRGPSHNRIGEHGGAAVRYPPELPGQTVVERRTPTRVPARPRTGRSRRTACP